MENGEEDTMRTCIVCSEEMVSSKPDTVEIIQDFGTVGVNPAPHVPKEMYTVGTGMWLKGPKSEFKNWLGSYDGIWVYEGAPQMEKFKIVHVKSEAESE